MSTLAGSRAFPLTLTTAMAARPWAVSTVSRSDRICLRPIRLGLLLPLVTLLLLATPPSIAANPMGSDAPEDESRSETE